VLDRLLADQPRIERELELARHTLGSCQAWLKALPADVTLEMVKARPNTNGVDLDGLRERIQKAEDEIEQLRAVPVPRSDIEQCVKNYVANLATPQVRRIADGEPLQVTWPGDTIAALAFLLPEQMTAALLKEIDCLANSPMSLQACKRRVAELKAEIDTLQRQALALGEDASSLPPEVVLGVKIMRQPMSRTMRAEQRTERRLRVTSEEVEA
jgi:hypothetical protein